MLGTTYKYSGDIKLTLENLARPTLIAPADPAENASQGAICLWEKCLDEFMKRESMLEENIKTAYSLIYGQCSDALRQRLEGCENHETTTSSMDAIGLLKNIKSVMYKYNGMKYPKQALHEACQQFYHFYQTPTMDCQTYQQMFNSLVQVIEHCKGEIGQDPERGTRHLHH